MRITRSTLRRLIAEESTRLFREAKGKGTGDDSFMDYNPEEIPDMGDQYNPDYYESLDDEDDDYYGDEDPFGDDEAIEKGYEYDPATAGYKKPGVEDDYYGDDDPFGDDAALAQGKEYGPDGFDMTEGDDMTDDDGTFGGPPRVDYDGQYTSPQFVKGTPQHREMHRGPPEPSFSQIAPRGHAQGGGNDYSEYDSKHYGPGINENLSESRWAQLAGILKG